MVVNERCLLLCVVNNRVIKLVSRGPEGFRELWEARWNHFHLSWYLSDSAVTMFCPKLCVIVEETVLRFV